MVATLAQMASAAYYLESQRSFRHPNEYYTAGEEPDGVWWNPSGLFGLADGGRVDGGDFHRLYHGFAPGDGERLTRNAGSEKRSPGLDMTFSADKSVSALWALADPELRSQIECAHNDAARAALTETVLRYCAWTRLQERDGTRVVAADIMGAMFQHGTSRENDPQLHTHCTIFNAARTHRDGKYRALHQHPVYAWMKAAGALYRNALAWNLRDRFGIRMEQYGKDNEFTRIAGFAPSAGRAGQEPAALIAQWSKRRGQIVEAAREMGFTVEGNAPRAAAANKITRAGKSPDNEPEIRHARWRGEAGGYVEREALIASLLGKSEEITQEQIRALTEVLEDLPYRLTREEAVFRLPDIVERVGNATAGLLNHEAVATSIERVLLSPEVVRLTRPPRSAEGLADMAHTRLYSTRDTLQMEQEVRDMAAGMAADKGHSLSAQVIEARVTELLKAGYPLSEETDRGDPGRSPHSRAGSPSSKERQARARPQRCVLSPISTVKMGATSSPQPWHGARQSRLVTTSRRGRSASTSCCASPRGAGWRLTRIPPLSLTRRGCCRPARHITFSSSPSVMERRSSSRATHNNSNLLRRDRG